MSDYAHFDCTFLAACHESCTVHAPCPDLTAEQRERGYVSSPADVSAYVAAVKATPVVLGQVEPCVVCGKPIEVGKRVRAFSGRKRVT